VNRERERCFFAHYYQRQPWPAFGSCGRATETAAGSVLVKSFRSGTGWFRSLWTCERGRNTPLFGPILATKLELWKERPARKAGMVLVKKLLFGSTDSLVFLSNECETVALFFTADDGRARRPALEVRAGSLSRNGRPVFEKSRGKRRPACALSWPAQLQWSLAGVHDQF